MTQQEFEISIVRCFWVGVAIYFITIFIDIVFSKKWPKEKEPIQCVLVVEDESNDR